MNGLWIVALTSGVVAAVVTSIFQVINGWRERAATDRRHSRELALKAAVIQWEHDVKMIEQANRQLSYREEARSLTEIDFDMILVRKLKLMELFGAGEISPRVIEAGFKAMGTISGEIKKARTDNLHRKEKTDQN